MALLVSGPMEASLICGISCASNGFKSKRAWKILDGRTAGEGDPIRAFFQQARGGAVAVLGFGHGFVAGDVIHDGAHLLQFVGQVRGWPLRRATEGFSGSRCSHISRWRRRFLTADKFLGHQIHLEMQFAQFGGGGRADGGDAHAADVAQVLEDLEEKFKKGVTPLGLVKTSQS